MIYFHFRLEILNEYRLAWFLLKFFNDNKYLIVIFIRVNIIRIALFDFL